MTRGLPNQMRPERRWDDDACSVPAARAKGWSKPPNGRCVSRPSRFSNPFRLGPRTDATRPPMPPWWPSSAPRQAPRAGGTTGGGSPRIAGPRPRLLLLAPPTLSCGSALGVGQPRLNPGTIDLHRGLQPGSGPAVASGRGPEPALDDGTLPRREASTHRCSTQNLKKTTRNLSIPDRAVLLFFNIY